MARELSRDQLDHIANILKLLQFAEREPHPKLHLNGRNEIHVRHGIPAVDSERTGLARYYEGAIVKDFMEYRLKPIEKLSLHDLRPRLKVRDSGVRPSR
jgi:hypothetical protein